MRDQLVTQLGVDRRTCTPPTACSTTPTWPSSLARPARAALPAVDGRHPAARLQRGDGSDIFAAMREGDMLVHHPYDAFDTSVERVHRPGRRRSRRAGDQAHDLPHVGRFADRAEPDPGRRAGQAGGGAGGAQGPLRRGDATSAGRGPSSAPACTWSTASPASRPTPSGADRPPRGRRHPPLRPHRHGQLPPDDGPAVHRLRAVHMRPGHRRGRRRPVQLPHRVRAAARYRKLLVARSTCATRILAEIVARSSRPTRTGQGHDRR